MNLIETLVVALAVWQAVEIWHHAFLFASLRARLELSQRWITNLLLCPFCLSVWVSLFAVTLLIVSQRLDEFIIAAPLYVLACSRLANLGNDGFRSFCRTPGRSDELGEPLAEPTSSVAAEGSTFTENHP